MARAELPGSVTSIGPVWSVNRTVLRPPPARETLKHLLMTKGMVPLRSGVGVLWGTDVKAPGAGLGSGGNKDSRPRRDFDGSVAQVPPTSVINVSGARQHETSAPIRGRP